MYIIRIFDSSSCIGFMKNLSVYHSDVELTDKMDEAKVFGSKEEAIEYIEMAKFLGSKSEKREWAYNVAEYPENA